MVKTWATLLLRGHSYKERNELLIFCTCGREQPKWEGTGKLPFGDLVEGTEVVLPEMKKA